MAKYKAYPEYKDSGVEWLGVIPVSWKVTRLKLETLLNMGQSPSSDDCNIEGNGLAFLQGNAEFGKINPIEKQYCPVAKKTANPGDILFSVRAPVGAINYADKKYGIGRGLCSISESKKIISSFLWWLLPTYKYQLDAIATGSTFEAVSAEQLGNLSFTLPSISEQFQIADFLDHETAKIDNLIEKQQQLIELLKEKRQAVISHAVTKGLNPDVPMKDSGVEWLGEVPEHWELVPLKYLCNFSGGGTPTKDNLSYWQGGTVPWVSPKDMKSFWISETQDYVTPKAVSESSTNYVEEGSLLMVVRSGILQRNIPVAINIVKVTINQDMKALRFNERMKAYYAAYFINGNVNSLLLEWTKEGATVESIEHEYLANGLIPVPPIDEQYSIIKSISDQMIRFELLEEKALTGIRLLQERRTALISAAVTGKIDVRDWVAPDTQKTEETAA
ncbi:restriction endonuclease [Morganella morganii]|uniref:restriction endonuclease subunit S n=1 Tax=Morganella morganii TaxID=582 RepID=UPI00062C54E2|nr:restriction endonuclease subunit S [Morganella morganii]KKY68815.1 restriction endonuclease [Morganella morganii]